MDTTNYLSENDILSSCMKPPLSVSVSGWLISDNEEFSKPLSDYFTQWSNVTFTSLSRIEFNAICHDASRIKTPDIIIIDEKSEWNKTTTLIKEGISKTIPIILITNNATTEILRNALKFEIKDVLTIPFDESELDQIIIKCAEIKSANRKHGKTSIFINAKGGMGASILSTSIAHIIALQNESVVLIDPDAQFGSSSGLLSTYPKYTLSEALTQVDSLDEYALSGMLSKHESGLRFIPNRSEHLSDSIPEFKADSFREFLEHVTNNFDHIIIDLSRGLENSTLPAVSNAENVFIVVQQNIPAIQEASVLIKQLKHMFGFNQHQIKIIVNRYSNSIDIKPEEIKKSLHVDDIILVPNDYLSVSASTNLGELLATHFEKKPIVKVLRNIVNVITGHEIEQEKGFKRLFAFLRS
ncbi:AAA family ATPase [Photobacterium lutimaris]|uniref:Type II/IV secretion system ATPase TadZ/CpaE, associated with Flp pilus assembly n=1 Tax=Photobacterium lutimaris TaxID=388278 RepID=A0A2T3J3W8_9GAMM|nr:AAA family ATPase [Photobacterium lutimaris]PSU35992.1 Type II/IV secretion system ATPase TadZ/CpaE, associated with Flp pilus assembly [Photobacterium lutimaris]TDR79082.1 pilus assembly protein CpaE [Photobacterium lutimaris]